MNLPEKFGRGGLSSIERDTIDALTQIGVGTTIDVARVRGIAAVQAAKIDALGDVTDVAGDRAVRTMERAAVKAQEAPFAIEHLVGITNTGIAAMRALIEDTERKLR